MICTVRSFYSAIGVASTTLLIPSLNAFSAASSCTLISRSNAAMRSLDLRKICSRGAAACCSTHPVIICLLRFSQDGREIYGVHSRPQSQLPHFRQRRAITITTLFPLCSSRNGFTSAELTDRAVDVDADLSRARGMSEQGVLFQQFIVRIHESIQQGLCELCRSWKEQRTEDTRVQVLHSHGGSRWLRGIYYRHHEDIL